LRRNTAREDYELYVHLSVQSPLRYVGEGYRQRVLSAEQKGRREHGGIRTLEREGFLTHKRYKGCKKAAPGRCEREVFLVIGREANTSRGAPRNKKTRLGVSVLVTYP